MVVGVEHLQTFDTCLLTDDLISFSTCCLAFNLHMPTISAFCAQTDQEL